jgi:hypothetical protein
VTAVLTLQERLWVRLYPDKSFPQSLAGYKFGEWSLVSVRQLTSKVVLFLVRIDAALLLEDDINLFPSDNLVVKLRTLATTKEAR